MIINVAEWVTNERCTTFNILLVISLQPEDFYGFSECILHFELKYLITRPIRRTVIFSLEILEKNNDECILILVIYWKKTGLLHTKISNHNVIYSS